MTEAKKATRYWHCLSRKREHVIWESKIVPSHLITLYRSEKKWGIYVVPETLMPRERRKFEKKAGAEARVRVLMKIYTRAEKAYLKRLKEGY